MTDDILNKPLGRPVFFLFKTRLAQMAPLHMSWYVIKILACEIDIQQTQTADMW